MVLQITGRHAVGQRAFASLLDHVRFVFAERQEQDLPCIQDRAQPHRDGVRRNVLLAKETRGGVDPCHGIEHAQTHTTVTHAEWLVESDVPVAANSQEHDIDSTGRINFRFVLPAVGVHFFDGTRPVGNMDVRGWNVDVLEQMLLHPVVITLRLVVGQPEILIDVESDDVREVDSFFFVQADQLTIDTDGRRTDGQSQDGLLSQRISLADHAHNDLCHASSQVLARFKHVARNTSPAD